jgi:hypothetical protein
MRDQHGRMYLSERGGTGLLRGGRRRGRFRADGIDPQAVYDSVGSVLGLPPGVDIKKALEQAIGPETLKKLEDELAKLKLEAMNPGMVS